MNSEFEKKLMEQPLRQTPPAWRAEILREARTAAVQPSSVVTGWRSWLWPAPKAWAALAACWLVLLAVNAFNQTKQMVRVASTDSKAIKLALAEKRRALQDVDVVVAVNHAKPVAPRLPHGSSGWLRKENGELPC
ncbi:MAG: hypothetical protein NTY53_27280 [Kiritimatiellaeota bacterium]|nr:hypothetical protein [Kiritimatiellota bacterium]